MGAREGVEAHQGQRHRGCGQLGEGPEFGRRHRPEHPAARQQNGPLRGRQGLGGAPDLDGVPGGYRTVSPQFDMIRVPEWGSVVQDILRKVNQHRARLAGRGDIEGLLDDPRELLHVPHQVVVLGAGPGDADDVGLLERIVPDHRGVDLPRQHHHRDRVHVGRGYPGHGVGGPRAGGDEADPRPPRRAGVPVGGVDRTLLVTDKDVLQRRVEERVVQRQHRAAREAEDDLHPLRQERLDDHLGAGDRHRPVLSLPVARTAPSEADVTRAA